MANFNLGTSLQLAGQFKDDPAMLKQAITAYRNSLKEYRRANSPRQWALVQANLGSALQSLASHDENPVDVWKESIAARRAALEVLTRDNAATDWATAQNGLGTCLLNVSNFAGEAALLPQGQGRVRGSD